MNNLIFLAAGNAILWLVAFVLIYAMVGRQQRLEEKYQVLDKRFQNDSNP